MYLSLNWLKDFVKIPASLSPEKLAEKMTLHTVEVDGVEKQEEKFENIVVGKILEVKTHPNADRLQLAKVDINNKELNIVCGAPNIKAGQMVPVALIGAVLPNGLEIKEAEVRGEKSEGMLCAEDELGLGSDHSGILILNKNAKAGQSFGKYLKLDDVIIEVDNKSITHRPDLWGHYGIAREIAAFLNIKFAQDQKVDLKNIIKNKGGKKSTSSTKVEVKDKKLCPRYMAIRVDGIKIEDSPKWMQERLIAVGLRPINNIVDITNYVMLELGQPLHAFDADKVDNIVVRRAKKNEIIKTLDEEERKLDDNILVIADSKNPIAIAGVMGGVNSEVDFGTKSIILESANFEPVNVRKNAQKLGLRTEAVMRFEKSLDPNLAEMAMARALELIKKVCSNAKIDSNLVDEKRFDLDQGPIKLNLDWLKKTLGQKINSDQVVKILISLGFEVKVPKNVKDITLEVKVPTWRATKDISIPEDLVEEVARIYGYNNLDIKMPKTEVSIPAKIYERALERIVKQALSSGGRMIEVYNYSFVGEKQLAKLDIDFNSYVRLANPIASGQELLRQNLTPNLIENVKLNQARYNSFDFFEIGSVYYNFPGDVNKSDKGNEKLPYQERRVGLLCADDNNESAISRLKGKVEYLLKKFDLKCEYEVNEDPFSWGQENFSALIKVADNQIGFISVLKKEIAKKSNVKKSVAIAEINLKDFTSAVSSKADRKYVEIPKCPPVVRDLAFVVDNKILYNKIKANIVDFDKLIKKVELFDVYQGEEIGAGKKNLAFHIVYQGDRTLTGEEIEELQKKLAKNLEKKFGAIIRDF